MSFTGGNSGRGLPLPEVGEVADPTCGKRKNMEKRLGYDFLGKHKVFNGFPSNKNQVLLLVFIDELTKNIRVSLKKNSTQSIGIS